MAPVWAGAAVGRRVLRWAVAEPTSPIPDRRPPSGVDTTVSSHASGRPSEADLITCMNCTCVFRFVTSLGHQRAAMAALAGI